MLAPDLSVFLPLDSRHYEYIITVEVDATTPVVEAVLSQAVSEPPLLHPCAFFSWKLSPAEQTYDVGNCELLAIKLALEKWHHWLEGATHQFTIITDHKNLQYLFNFKITYRPGSKNVKADALSRQFSIDSPTEPEPIIPPDLIVSPIIWDIDKNIRNTTLQEPALPEYPEGKIYVPHSQSQTLLGTAHKSLCSGHLGSRRTLLLLQTRYWWPSMHRDITRYVQSCSVCAMSNSPRQLPAGKLVSLWRLPNNCSSKYSVILVSRKRLCRTGVLNSSPMSGKHSSSYWVSLLISLLVTIHRQWPD
ncbi:Transposon Tf2-9 polyprotein [Labeo rohita]|uniref:Gypsy retrotransposon integrase-like protein 1 n=1 Tax=Labeo rohita TaxID=84645 RepID=A0ABQ8M565_LABRO|nr:Transposon Tf2-9 polyprotein [Labeo rohita]